MSRLSDELADLALSGRGWQELLARLREATGRDARLLGVHGQVMASAPDGARGAVDPGTVAHLGDIGEPAPLECSDGWRGTAVALRAGRRHVGLLALEGPPDERCTAMLLDARVPVCIVAVRRDVEAAARAESGSRLIDEVRYGPLRDPDQVLRAAERFGLALDLPHAAAVFAYDGGNQQTWATALSWIEMPVRHADGAGWTVLVGDTDAELTRIRTRLQGMVGGDADVLAASGSVVTEVGETSRSFFEAEAALALLRRRPTMVELRFSGLGLAGLLLSVHRDRLRAFVNRELRPILERDDLILTLTAWLEANGSRAAVAHRLGIHRNSVGYRMGRIRELLGFDPLDAREVLRIHAAIVAREVLIVLDEHPGRRPH